jgi:MOSC domain-containing protein YiiM
MGKLLNIATRNASRAPMQTKDTATITIESGVEGDYRGTIKHRQVTVVAREAWALACVDLNTDIDWTARRANLFIEGIDLNETTGQQLHIGDVILEMTGETTPCPRMDEAYQGLQAALVPDWRAGATCTVLKGGQISVGDAVQIEAPLAV